MTGMFPGAAVSPSRLVKAAWGEPPPQAAVARARPMTAEATRSGRLRPGRP